MLPFAKYYEVKVEWYKYGIQSSKTVMARRLVDSVQYHLPEFLELWYS